MGRIPVRGADFNPIIKSDAARNTRIGIWRPPNREICPEELGWIARESPNNVNSFDTSLIQFLNRYAQRSWIFDHAVATLAGNPIFKGVLAMTAFWWLWFRRGNTPNEQERRYLIFGLVSSSVGLALARTLAYLLPFRERPLDNPALHFQIPFGVDPKSLLHWSSMPSDHATLYFSLAITFFFVSRVLGVVALAYTSVFICFPRIYLGIHYPTDILIGALLGIGISSLGGLPKVRTPVTNPFWQWLQKSPPSFYAFLFLWSFSLADQFDSLRALGRIALKLVR